MNEPTLILDEGGMPILEQCEGVTMPADYSFKCINNYVHCESPQYEDLQHLALGMSSHIEDLRKENEQLRAALGSLSKRCYIMSESHQVNDVRGARLIVGFNNIADAGDAHSAISALKGGAT